MHSRDEQITAAATANDTEAADTLHLFCAMLGTVAGNMALMLGATGGVYIAGGIVPRFQAVFEKSEFRSKFEQKGRLSTYLQAITTYLVLHESPALLGLAKYADSSSR